MQGKANASVSRLSAAAAAAAAEAAAAAYRLRCGVNGEAVELAVSPSRRLVDVLREDLALTGTKRACDIGRCGACMVLVDGRPMNACLTMAYQCEGAEVTTIEGIGRDAAEGIDPIQRAFLEEGGFQCGYCTPGMVVSVKALLASTPHPTDADIEEALSGNLCRCTGYGSIQRAVRRAIDMGGQTG
ncbi:(2Fe-2S)-binding protein [Paenibacillus sp. TRM 82003]|nr:(2Fe-2S)-binding protein [Paenibacillus sp. TRM 82003]